MGSGYAILFGCNRKSDVAKNLGEYLKHWPPPLTSSYHSDGAKELINADIQRVLESYSPAIGFLFSTAYSPNQNAFVERLSRTLADMSHPNLLLSSMLFSTQCGYIIDCLVRLTKDG